jgi:hypothetical protein
VGTSAVAFDVGALMLAGCGLAYWAFERLSEPFVPGRLAGRP